jgi:hypothetical protein
MGDTPLPWELANVVWSVDFKGQFRLGNGRYCYPLTVQHSYAAASRIHNAPSPAAFACQAAPIATRGAAAPAGSR